MSSPAGWCGPRPSVWSRSRASCSTRPCARTPEPDAQAPCARRRHLDLHAERTADESILRVAGAVDLSNRDELADAISMAMLGAADVRRVTVDVRGLGRIGPAAVDVLTAALRRSTAHGITLTIVGGGLGDTAASASAHRSSIASRS